MNTHTFILLAFFLAVATACNNDKTHKGEGPKIPGQSVETAFWEKYPDASSVQWERAGNFQKAEFVLNTTDYDAWYTSSGILLQTQYSSTYSELPSVVKAYIANSINYPPTSWTPQNETGVLERRNYPVWYETELKKGEEEVYIWSDEEAFNHRDITEDFDEEDIPGGISDFITSKYSQGFITEAWKLPNASYIANVLDGNEVKEIYFNQSMGWTYTAWPVLAEDLPDAVKTVLAGNVYENYSVKSAVYQEYPEQTYYFIILQPENSQDPTISVRINSQGQIIL